VLVDGLVDLLGHLVVLLFWCCHWVLVVGFGGCSLLCSAGVGVGVVGNVEVGVAFVR
jgi:hypothetical protein